MGTFGGVRRGAVVLGLLGALQVPAAVGQSSDIEKEPICYSDTRPNNAVSRLEERLAAGKTKLAYEEGRGYLQGVLRELKVPVSSQVLVFSKTSLQRNRIGPRTPRAIYFNDDVYVGYCRQGEVMELSATDDRLGTVFYVLDQTVKDRPVLKRQTESCLLCHGSSANQGYPGHLVRSVYTDHAGLPVLTAGGYRTDQTSPLQERWGGWYVTGRHGKQMHMGNWIVHGRGRPDLTENLAGQNVTSLKDRIDVDSYLSPHSDLVALMVLEHQSEMHNRITRAGMQTRQALHFEQTLNRELGNSRNERWPSTTSRIKSAGEPLVQYLLFSGEAALTEPVEGTSEFAREFAAVGPRDRKGRSLRDLDLKRRLLRYPCSYLIYSSAFDALPGEVKEYVWQRLWDILNGRDPSREYAHLSAEDRTAILEILRDTKKDLPASWRP
jgi:hypothetical protein